MTSHTQFNTSRGKSSEIWKKNKLFNKEIVLHEFKKIYLTIMLKISFGKGNLHKKKLLYKWLARDIKQTETIYYYVQKGLQAIKGTFNQRAFFYLF